MSEFCLLESPSGDFLAAGGAGLGHVPEAGDAALWRCSGEQLVHVQTGARLAPGPSFEIDGTGYRRIPGPPRLPSACLDELREHGMTVLPNVLSGADADVIRDGFMDAWHRQHPDAGAHDGRMSIMDALAWCAPLARAVTHPVALWLMRRYMATGEIHFAHQPVITTAKPARDLLGTRACSKVTAGPPTRYMACSSTSVSTRSAPTTAPRNTCRDPSGSAGGRTMPSTGRHASASRPTRTSCRCSHRPVPP